MFLYSLEIVDPLNRFEISLSPKNYTSFYVGGTLFGHYQEGVIYRHTLVANTVSN